MSRSIDISEGGLESLIVAALTGAAPAGTTPARGLTEEQAPFTGPDDYIEGDGDDFDRVHALDFVQLAAFIQRPPSPPLSARCRSTATRKFAGPSWPASAMRSRCAA